jgi:predicted dinucleotide-binding enzyme
MAMIGFMRTGATACALARPAVAAGLDVVLSNSHGRETLSELFATLGDRARAATPEEAARAAI